jgi:hypothetical protein
MATQRFVTRVDGENRLQTVDVGLSTGVAGQTLSGHTAVAMNAEGLLIPGDCTDMTTIGNVVGVIANAYIAGSTVTVRVANTLDNLGWSWTPNAPVFVGTNGSLEQTLPPGAKYAQVIGMALTSTKIHIKPQPAIVLA